jgi:predicted Na+-dependent transporter
MILGIAALASSFTGIISIRSTHPGLEFLKYPNLLERVVAGIFGLLVVLVAFWVRRRSMIAWKAIAYLLPIGWVFFVIGSTLSGASAYANPSKRDTLIMGGIIGILSFPVMLYWERRWLKQKDQFQNN